MSWYRIHARLHKNFCRFHMFSRQIGQFRLSARPWNEKKIERIRILSYLSGFSKQKCTIDGCNPVSHAFGYANDCFLICMTGHTKFTTFLVRKSTTTTTTKTSAKTKKPPAVDPVFGPSPNENGRATPPGTVGPLVRSLEMEGHGASISRIIRPFIGTRYNSI